MHVATALPAVRNFENAPRAFARLRRGRQARGYRKKALFGRARGSESELSGDFVLAKMARFLANL